MPLLFLPLVLIVIILPTVSADECFTSGQIFGIVFGSVVGAFIISGGIALALWYLHRKYEQGKFFKNVLMRLYQFGNVEFIVITYSKKF